MAMDSVSLPVVSSTAPPPVRSGASAPAGAAPAAPSARGPRTDAGKASAPHGSGESRSFDDVLSDVHAAKHDTATTHTTAKSEDDTDEPASASSDAGQVQPAVVVVAPVPVVVPEQEAAAKTSRHTGGDTERGNHARLDAADALIPDAAAAVQSSLPPVAGIPAVVAPQPQAPAAQNAAHDKTVPAATDKLSSECTTAIVPEASSDAGAPAVSAKKTVPPGDHATTAQFELQPDRSAIADGARAADPAPLTSGTTSASRVTAALPVEAAVSERAPVRSTGVQSRVVSEQKSVEPPANMPVRSAPVDDAPAAPAPVPQNDAAAQAATTVARRATSRAAAQAVIAKIVRQDGQAAETPAPAVAEQARGESLRVAPPSTSTSGASIGADAGKPSAKPELRRAQIADTVAIAAASPSGHADTAPGEHRNTGQGTTGQDAAPLAKVLASAVPAHVVVAPSDVRQAFERMVREVTSAAPTLDAPSGAAVTDQIVRGMQLQVKGNVGEARITLAPEHLGEVVVEMRVEKDGVVATLRADTPAVRGWLATHQDDLRAGLADVGLRLDDLQISERDSQRGRQQPSADQQPQTPRRARRTSTGELPRFEVEA